MKLRLNGIITLALLFFIEKATATEFEAKNLALSKILGATKGIKRKIFEVADLKLDSKITSSEPIEVYAFKEGETVKQIAVIQKRIYPPQCTHTWVIGISPKTGSVTEIRPIEMSCPHAFPCKEASFLDQYKSINPSKLKNLKGKVDTIAKATGTSDLTTDAVITAVTAAKLYLQTKS